MRKWSVTTERTNAHAPSGGDLSLFSTNNNSCWLVSLCALLRLPAFPVLLPPSDGRLLVSYNTSRCRPINQTPHYLWEIGRAHMLTCWKKRTASPAPSHRPLTSTACLPSGTLSVFCMWKIIHWCQPRYGAYIILLRVVVIVGVVVHSCAWVNNRTLGRASI